MNPALTELEGKFEVKEEAGSPENPCIDELAECLGEDETGPELDCESSVVERECDASSSASLCDNNERPVPSAPSIRSKAKDTQRVGFNSFEDIFSTGSTSPTPSEVPAGGPLKKRRRGDSANTSISHAESCASSSSVHVTEGRKICLHCGSAQVELRSFSVNRADSSSLRYWCRSCLRFFGDALSKVDTSGLAENEFDDPTNLKKHPIGDLRYDSRFPTHFDVSFAEFKPFSREDVQRDHDQASTETTPMIAEAMVICDDQNDLVATSLPAEELMASPPRDFCMEKEANAVTEESCMNLDKAVSLVDALPAVTVVLDNISSTSAAAMTCDKTSHRRRRPKTMRKVTGGMRGRNLNSESSSNPDDEKEDPPYLPEKKGATSKEVLPGGVTEEVAKKKPRKTKNPPGGRSESSPHLDNAACVNRPAETSTAASATAVNPIPSAKTVKRKLKTSVDGPSAVSLSSNLDIAVRPASSSKGNNVMSPSVTSTSAMKLPPLASLPPQPSAVKAPQLKVDKFLEAIFPKVQPSKKGSSSKRKVAPSSSSAKAKASSADAVRAVVTTKSKGTGKKVEQAADVGSNVSIARPETSKESQVRKKSAGTQMLEEDMPGMVITQGSSTQTDLDARDYVTECLSVEWDRSFSISANDDAAIIRRLKMAQMLARAHAREMEKLKQQNDRLLDVCEKSRAAFCEMKGLYSATLLRIRDDIHNQKQELFLYQRDLRNALDSSAEKAAEDAKQFVSVAQSIEDDNSKLRKELNKKDEELRNCTELLNRSSHDIMEMDRDVFVAREHATLAQKKLEDRLFVANNERCTSCKVFEKHRDVLTSRVAEKTVALEKANHVTTKMAKMLETKEHSIQAAMKEVSMLKFERDGWRNDSQRLEKTVKKLRTELTDLGHSNVCACRSSAINACLESTANYRCSNESRLLGDVRDSPATTSSASRTGSPVPPSASRKTEPSSDSRSFTSSQNDPEYSPPSSFSSWIKKTPVEGDRPKSASSNCSANAFQISLNSCLPSSLAEVVDEHASRSSRSAEDEKHKERGGEPRGAASRGESTAGTSNKASRDVVAADKSKSAVMGKCEQSESSAKMGEGASRCDESSASPRVRSVDADRRELTSIRSGTATPASETDRRSGFSLMKQIEAAVAVAALERQRSTSNTPRSAREVSPTTSVSLLSPYDTHQKLAKLSRMDSGRTSVMSDDSEYMRSTPSTMKSDASSVMQHGSGSAPKFVGDKGVMSAEGVSSADSVGSRQKSRQSELSANNSLNSPYHVTKEVESRSHVNESAEEFDVQSSRRARSDCEVKNAAKDPSKGARSSREVEVAVRSLEGASCLLNSPGSLVPHSRSASINSRRSSGQSRATSSNRKISPSGSLARLEAVPHSTSTGRVDVWLTDQRSHPLPFNGPSSRSSSRQSSGSRHELSGPRTKSPVRLTNASESFCHEPRFAETREKGGRARSARSRDEGYGRAVQGEVSAPSPLPRLLDIPLQRSRRFSGSPRVASFDAQHHNNNHGRLSGGEASISFPGNSMAAENGLGPSSCRGERHERIGPLEGHVDRQREIWNGPARHGGSSVEGERSHSRETVLSPLMGRGPFRDALDIAWNAIEPSPVMFSNSGPASVCAERQSNGPVIEDISWNCHRRPEDRFPDLQMRHADDRHGFTGGGRRSWFQ